MKQQTHGQRHKTVEKDGHETTSANTEGTRKYFVQRGELVARGLGMCRADLHKLDRALSPPYEEERRASDEVAKEVRAQTETWARVDQTARAQNVRRSSLSETVAYVGE
jgi:hypothetical protein